MIDIDEEDRCMEGGGHIFGEIYDYTTGGKTFQVLRCERCGKTSTGWTRVGDKPACLKGEE